MVVGFAILGGRQGTGPQPAVSAVPQSAPAAATASTATRHAAATLDPSEPRSLVVRGWVARSSNAAGVIVTSLSGSRIALGAMDPTGKPRNGMVPFETRFSLPRASLDPAEQLFVIAADAAGFPLRDGHSQAVEGAIVEMVVR